MLKLKFLVRLLLAAITLPVGWVVHSISGTTPAWARQSMIRLFSASGGITNDLMSRFLSLRYPARPIAPMAGVLSALPSREIMRAADIMRERGHFVLPQRVPSETCDRLLEFALTQPALVYTRHNHAWKRVVTVYEPTRPLAAHYQFDRKNVIDHPDVQALMADPVLVELAQAYLEVEPVADFIKMWWYTASSQPEPSQLYHCDMSRIKWVRFFIYLTDVGVGNGPHCFVIGTHRTGAIPSRFLARGYAHISDEDVVRHYGAQEIVELIGPRGTIIAEDTRGLHKGQQVHVGHRLMLQIQFSNSLFGHPHPRTAFESLKDPGLIEMSRRHPR
ncbi:MAG: phytanoyl-CoA dioxygenase family protein, partial [Candidatus Rokuibacteriota bacterium]